MKSFLRLLIAFILPSLAFASSLTNADIVKMSGANLDESIILTSIDNSVAKFDTSPEGLIELSTAKVSQTIIAAMIKKNSSANDTTGNDNHSQTVVAPESTSELMSPSEVMMIDGGETKAMRYLSPQTRSAARGLGFGGFATYAVLNGSLANTRITRKSPSFLVSVPNQAQVESYLTLASFAVRKNNTREVLTGGGYMSYSSGIHPDRIIAIATEKYSDQGKAQKGFTIYKVTPKKAMATGEYAVVLYTGQMQGVVSPWFGGGAGNSFFDFGVDP